ncbi:MAG: hypothetical protein WC761_06280 [Candidatus Paceibacterota bacterium]|jgi:hypothetical protein
MENFGEKSPQESFESSKMQGEAYVSMIKSLAGENETSESPVSPELEPYKEAADHFFSKQKERFEQGEFSARKLLLQAFPAEKIPPEVEDETKCSVEETSPGVFILNIDDELYRKIRPSARALAVKIKGGVSFVVVPRYGKEALDQREREENVPHEIHHLAWQGVKEADLAHSTEENIEMQKAFTMFQDELLARLSSDGTLSGYSHITMLSPTAKGEFERTYPAIYKMVMDTTVRMNEFLEDVNRELSSRGIPQDTLIGSVVGATSFESLWENITKIRSHIGTLPLAPARNKSKGQSWDFL